MTVYLENKALYNRLLAGDGTSLTCTDVCGALNVHQGFKTHTLTTVMELSDIASGNSVATDTIDFGSTGDVPGSLFIYIDNPDTQNLNVTGQTSPDGLTWYDHTTTSDNAKEAIVVYSGDTLPGLDRYTRFNIFNNDFLDASVSVQISYYV